MKKCSRTYFASFVFLFLLGCSAKSASAAEVRPPNFIFILIDDLGWTDLGCFGSTFYKTPNIDKLAAHGMKFTDAVPFILSSATQQRCLDSSPAGKGNT